jgi:hypothetical protein
MLRYVENEQGFSVVPCHQLKEYLANLLLASTRRVFDSDFHGISHLSDFLSGESNHAKIESKENRIFTHSESIEIGKLVRSLFELNPQDYITDEERLGYENFYWRCVRAGQRKDVGSLHADSWFWVLGGYHLPAGYRRVKVWMPLFQDDGHPSLLVLPGSHQQRFEYSRTVGVDGKSRPLLRDQIPSHRIVNCPVSVGHCVVFHDDLIHGGAVTSVTRLSVEFTCAVRAPASSKAL